MLLKLNNPDVPIPRILGTHTQKTKTITRKDKLPPAVWYPPEIRHTDLGKFMVKSQIQMTPTELRKAREIEAITEKVKKGLIECVV